MADPFLRTPEYGGYHFFEGFHGLTEQGVPKEIQDQYENAVKRASWFAYNGMWNSASKGIVKGILVTSGLALLGAAVVGILGGATGYGSMFTGVDNIVEGMSRAITGLFSLPLKQPIATLSIASVGAAFGAVYEVHQHRDAVQEELMKIHGAIRNAQAEARDQQIGLARAGGVQTPQEPAHGAEVIHDFDPMGEVQNEKGLAEWKARVAARKHGAALLDPASLAPANDTDELAAAEQERIDQQKQEMMETANKPKENTSSWIAKEEARNQERLNEIQQGKA